MTYCLLQKVLRYLFHPQISSSRIILKRQTFAIFFLKISILEKPYFHIFVCVCTPIQHFNPWCMLSLLWLRNRKKLCQKRVENTAVLSKLGKL